MFLSFVSKYIDYTKYTLKVLVHENNKKDVYYCMTHVDVNV